MRVSCLFSYHEDEGSISAGLAVHLRDVKLILCTIFWIFSSFFRMLAFMAQILSCWSLICCSSSDSSAFSGSTALSVMLGGDNQRLISVLWVLSVMLPPTQKPVAAKGWLHPKTTVKCQAPKNGAKHHSQLAGLQCNQTWECQAC